MEDGSTTKNHPCRGVVIGLCSRVAGAPAELDSSLSSVELLLCMGLDGAVRGGISHASENEASFNLVVVQEALIGLINCAGSDLACTC